ncbi:hypothetical protein M422DRAFT_263468 [Sphaerobolus stellatus SS14]|uniref:Glutaredoxin domain-containing protein n=1 Tax=Sphaerobolus stellatus (strain SS14) TaxID=990650 RepID=A0A0C9UI16_SPHS4|nr:hypothetical protein M422DRAFT_263468 [Sphaerobolus stellatus SS14]
MSVETLVNDQISNNKVVVFSKTYCPYCKAAKATLKQEVKASNNVQDDDVVMIK